MPINVPDKQLTNISPALPLQKLKKSAVIIYELKEGAGKFDKLRAKQVESRKKVEGCGYHHKFIDENP